MSLEHDGGQGIEGRGWGGGGAERADIVDAMATDDTSDPGTRRDIDRSRHPL